VRAVQSGNHYVQAAQLGCATSAADWLDDQAVVVRAGEMTTSFMPIRGDLVGLKGLQLAQPRPVSQRPSRVM